MSLEFASPDQVTLEDRLQLFKKDPEKMKVATDFVDDLLKRAKSDAEAKLREQDRAKAEADGELGLKRRIGVRARGFIVRIFEAICNCTNSGGPLARPPPTPSKK